MKKLTTFTTLIASLILMTLAIGCLETTSAKRVAMYEQAIEQVNQKSANTLASAQSELARLAPIKQKTDHVLQALEQRLAEVRDGGEVGLSDDVQFLGDALKTGGAAVPGPAGLYMTITRRVGRPFSTFPAPKTRNILGGRYGSSLNLPKNSWTYVPKPCRN